MDKKALQELKTSLEKERERLITELKTIAKPDPQIPGDWDATFPQFESSEYSSHASLEEEADEVEEYEVRLESEHSMESRLLEVNQALERMAKGTYGLCLKCQKEIQLERLKANPAAKVCVEHMS